MVNQKFSARNLFKFSQSKLCEDEPVAIAKLRAKADNVEAFDKMLDGTINLFTKQPEVDYPDGKNKKLISSRKNLI